MRMTLRPVSRFFSGSLRLCGFVEVKSGVAATCLGIVGLCLLGPGTVPAGAHHAFAAEFDARRPVLLKGKVTKVEWVNPHAWIHVEVSECSGSVTRCTNRDGTRQIWMVEGGTPNTLIRRGVTRNSLPPGIEIVIDGYQSKDRSTRANGRDITFADGRKLFLGSSGTGAPRDGRDPNERAKPKGPGR